MLRVIKLSFVFSACTLMFFSHGFSKDLNEEITSVRDLVSILNNSLLYSPEGIQLKRADGKDVCGTIAIRTPQRGFLSAIYRVESQCRQFHISATFKELDLGCAKGFTRVGLRFYHSKLRVKNKTEWSDQQLEIRIHHDANKHVPVLGGKKRRILQFCSPNVVVSKIQKTLSDSEILFKKSLFNLVTENPTKMIYEGLGLYISAAKRLGTDADFLIKNIDELKKVIQAESRSVEQRFKVASLVNGLVNSNMEDIYFVNLLGQILSFEKFRYQDNEVKKVLIQKVFSVCDRVKRKNWSLKLIELCSQTLLPIAEEEANLLMSSQNGIRLIHSRSNFFSFINDVLKISSELTFSYSEKND